MRRPDPTGPKCVRVLDSTSVFLLGRFLGNLVFPGKLVCFDLLQPCTSLNAGRIFRELSDCTCRVSLSSRQAVCLLDDRCASLPIANNRTVALLSLCTFSQQGIFMNSRKRWKIYPSVRNNNTNNPKSPRKHKTSAILSIKQKSLHFPQAGRGVVTNGWAAVHHRMLTHRFAKTSRTTNWSDSSKAWVAKM